MLNYATQVQAQTRLQNGIRNLVIVIFKVLESRWDTCWTRLDGHVGKPEELLGNKPSRIYGTRCVSTSDAWAPQLP
jgi:hypothetical protein